MVFVLVLYMLSYYEPLEKMFLLKFQLQKLSVMKGIRKLRIFPMHDVHIKLHLKTKIIL
jgi:hypothetical protein